MERHRTCVEDDVLYVETADGELAVGSLEAICAIVGGETYEIEYKRRQTGFATWLDTDEDGVMRIDVRETLADMSYPAEFVAELADKSDTSGPNEEYAKRTRFFAETMQRVWDTKGNLDDGENPFLS